MKKKKKHRVAVKPHKVTNNSHIQYFYSFFAIVAVGAVVAGFMQHTTSTQVLGAHDWGETDSQVAEERSLSIKEYGEAVWYNLVNSLPLR